MGNLLDSVIAIRDKIQQEKKVRLVSPPPAEKGPVSSLLSEHPSASDWQFTMKRLLVVSHIMEWVAEENDGLYVNLARLEGLCRFEARAPTVKEKQYVLRKNQYLSVLGQICELYYRAHQWEDVEFVSPGLGMKRIVLCLDEKNAKKAPQGFIVFLVREFPFLVTYDREQILFACTTKEQMPGSTIYTEM